MQAEMIFWPMIVLALATTFIYLAMLRVRIAGIKSGRVKPSVYRLNEGEPEDSRQFSNAIRNQFETPVLFYAVCLSAYVTDNAGTAMIVLAFGYAVAKLVHILIHLTVNRVTRRLAAFVVSLTILVIMWVLFAFQLATGAA